MKTTGKELVKQALERWKFPVIQETETGVLFRYQMSYIQACLTGDENSDAVMLSLEGVFTADNDSDMLTGLKTCNELTGGLVHVKLYINSDNKLVIASEFFYRNEEDMEYLLNMGLQTLVMAKKRFLQRYAEVEEETKLLAYLETESEKS